MPAWIHAGVEGASRLVSFVHFDAFMDNDYSQEKKRTRAEFPFKIFFFFLFLFYL